MLLLCYAQNPVDPGLTTAAMTSDETFWNGRATQCTTRHCPHTKAREAPKAPGRASPPNAVFPSLHVPHVPHARKTHAPQNPSRRGRAGKPRPRLVLHRRDPHGFRSGGDQQLPHRGGSAPRGAAREPLVWCFFLRCARRPKGSKWPGSSDSLDITCTFHYVGFELV